jgi:hypothetical protein
MKNFDLTKLVLLFGLLFLLLLQMTGCGDAGVINPESKSSDNATVSLKGDDNAFDDPAGVIVITEAKALLREIEFELEGSGIEHEINAGPIVVHFNFSGAVETILAGKIPAGVYNKVKFQIHKPEDNETPPDPEFKEGTSGNQRYSFIIKGTYNGNSFVYKSRKSANLVVNFSSPVNFQETGINLTMIFNSSTWFKNGNIFLDPRNPSNEDLIDNNLKNSFKRAFKDDDKDGRPDDN